MDEFDLIRRYFKRTQPSASGLVLGIGDDAALMKPPPHHELVITSDTLIAGRHFPHHTAPFDIGWKAVAVNLSDLAAMGAAPHSILLALSLPEADESFLSAFSQGLFALCDEAGVALIGGDTTRSPILSITITALGFVPQGQAIRRSGAVTGDLILVSGSIGDAAYALAHLDQPSGVRLRSRLDRPTPRLALGQVLRGYASAMLDVSDGLAQDFGHILKASDVAAWIDLAQVPRSSEVMALPVDEQARLVLGGGDDYELCLTMSDTHWQDFRHDHSAFAEELTVIGRVCTRTDDVPLHAPSNALTILYNQKPLPVAPLGFKHFE